MCIFPRKSFSINNNTFYIFVPILIVFADIIVFLGRMKEIKKKEGKKLILSRSSQVIFLFFSDQKYFNFSCFR